MKITDDDLVYLVSLHTVDGLGSVRLLKLFEYFGKGKRIWEAKDGELKGLGIPDVVIRAVKQAKIRLVPKDYFSTLLHSKINIITLCDNEYPELLKEIANPPFILYYKGHFPTLVKTIGVVGTRKATGYGKAVTEKLTKELVESGFVIVSGLARGVDTIAHNSCIESDGKTIAVLGGGLNKIYPPDNNKLADEIAHKFGCVISEFPPNYPHLPGNFPARNRIIAGLSQSVLVTEAAEDSGSLITARYAAEQGKDVFAVPGPINSSLSQGPLSLIKDGAKLVTSVDDILTELGISKNENKKIDEKILNQLNDLEKLVLELLSLESKHLDEISRELKLSVSKLSAILITLEIKGLIKNLGSGNYVRF